MKPYQQAIWDRLPEFPQQSMLRWKPCIEHCAFYLMCGELEIVKLIDCSFQLCYTAETDEDPYEWEVRTCGCEPMKLAGPSRDPIALICEFLAFNRIEYRRVAEPDRVPYCAVCGLPQFDTSHGRTCPNGHGGADSIYKESP